MENEHPNERELSDFVQFHLNVDRAHWVGRHLRICAECNARYREMYQGKPGAPVAPEMNLETGAERSSS